MPTTHKVLIGLIYNEQEGTRQETKGFLFWKKTYDVPHIVQKYRYFSKQINEIPIGIKYINVNGLGDLKIAQTSAQKDHIEHFLGNIGRNWSFDEHLNSTISYMSKSRFEEIRLMLLNDGFKEHVKS